MIIITSDNITVNQLCKMFVRKIGINENVLNGNNIIFIYNTTKLNTNSQEKIGLLFRASINVQISVIGVGTIIGA